MDRIPASERRREGLKALMSGQTLERDVRSELVRLAARRIIEEALEGEVTDAPGREYYARGAAPGAGYRNGYRSGRLKTAEGKVEYAAPQISDRAVRLNARHRCAICRRPRTFAALSHGSERGDRAAVGRLPAAIYPSGFLPKVKGAKDEQLQYRATSGLLRYSPNYRSA